MPERAKRFELIQLVLHAALKGSVLEHSKLPPGVILPVRIEGGILKATLANEGGFLFFIYQYNIYLFI
jgi:hypothetical protein